MRSRCESILTALDRAPIAYHVSFRLSNLRLLLKREAHSREMSAIYAMYLRVSPFLIFPLLLTLRTNEIDNKISSLLSFKALIYVVDS